MEPDPSKLLQPPDSIEEEYLPHNIKKVASREIIVPVVENDVDLDTVREYISQMKENKEIDKESSNKATTGSKLADFDSAGIGEREEIEILPIHSLETKEKFIEEYKRRLEISENKFNMSKEAINLSDPEKALLYATEASSILYEQFILGCKKFEEGIKYRVILEQKIKCILSIATIQYKQKNYREAIRALNSVFLKISK